MLTDKEQDDYLTDMAKELERTGGLVSIEDIEDFGPGRAAIFKVVVPIPTDKPHYHRWDVIDEEIMLVRCTVCGDEGYK